MYIIAFGNNKRHNIYQLVLFIIILNNRLNLFFHVYIALIVLDGVEYFDCLILLYSHIFLFSQSYERMASKLVALLLQSN